MTQVVAALLIGAVGYVAVRALLAERAGEDPRGAASGAFKVLAPGLFVVGLGLLAFLLFSSIVTVFVVLAILQLLTGEDAYGFGALAVLVGGAVFSVGTLVGGIWWGVKRLRRPRGSSLLE